MEENQGKKILYIDMDGVIVDFQSGIDRLNEYDRKNYEGHYDDAPGIFSLMDPLPGAIPTLNELTKHFDTYILSTASWLNPSAWSDKLIWVHKHFGEGKDSIFYKRLILSHNKHRCKGDFLVDDRTRHGAGEFQGELIQFVTKNGADEWKRVQEYLMGKL
jgi:5'-nucleotidase